ncbi:cyclic nucleotide-binding domain-containing protein [Bacteriovorax sp. Seq25_V]|uniref:cyclic nucleotide-binding domain-containing protein n=1 Tax=Bacteriovorax sp. Seq25_V TaxID=1201288 RepID=UPI000389E48F|nr:cyclic nucleotide-binding domain-containing protein [Bacteriovorax sp. Seq25_V]EQC43327.1 cyclic nucleotide-binding domain protein [Bacteriovorax sp. Seq25_V]
MSYEKNIEDRKIDRVDISLLKFFWQINPLLKTAKNKIPKFLRNLEVFKNFSDYELWELSKALHSRTFEKGDIIFRENDLGVGFYFIVRGNVDIVIENDHSVTGETTELHSKVVVSLEKNDYFGELALLQERHLRNATAVAKEPCELLGIFKPDLDIIINERPVIASKLLQSISLIISNRLYSVTQEVRKLKDRVKVLEEENADKNQ